MTKIFNTTILYSKHQGKFLFFRDLAEMAFTVAVFILIPLIAFTLITSKTSALLGFQSFTVLSGSMSPSIPVGSIVYTQKAEKFNIGDVITFKRKDINITHRIVAITDKSGKSVSSLVSPLPGAPMPREVFYKVKGDANGVPDLDLVNQNDIIGKTFVNIPSIGKITAFLRTVPGFLLFIVLPTLIYIGFELWNIKKEIVKQTEKKIMEKLRVV